MILWLLAINVLHCSFKCDAGFVSLRLQSKQRGYVAIAKLTNFHIQKRDGDKYDLTWCLPNGSSPGIFTQDGLQSFYSRNETKQNPKKNHPNRNTLYYRWERFEDIELDNLSLQVWAEKPLRLNNTLLPTKAEDHIRFQLLSAKNRNLTFQWTQTQQHWAKTGTTWPGLMDLEPTFLVSTVQPCCEYFLTL